MRKDCNLVLKHTLREWNVCIDILVNMEANLSYSLIMVNESIPSLSLTLLAGARGVSIIRTWFFFFAPFFLM